MADPEKFLEWVTGFPMALRDAVNSYFGAGYGGLVPPADNPLDATKYLSQTGWAVVISGRDVLTANRDYYVNNSTGSDSNNGLTALTAFATIQKGIDVVAALDLSIYDATINLATTGVNYTASNTFKSTVGAGRAIIKGDTVTPTNVVISTTSANCFFGSNIQGKWRVEGIRVQTTTSGSCFAVDGVTTNLTLGNVDFGATANDHMLIQEGAYLAHSASYSISGGAQRHVNMTIECIYTILSALTCTLSGTPAFTTFFQNNRVCYARAFGITYAGTGATGVRFAVASGSVLDTNGGGINFFPGSVAGTGTNFSVAPWGLYL